MNDHGQHQEFQPDLDELLGAYALDATDAQERAAIEQYLASNATACREVDDLREAAAMLALVHGEREPAPPHLWSKIQAEIATQTGGADASASEAAIPTSDAVYRASETVVPFVSRRRVRDNGQTRPRSQARSVSLRITASIAAIAAAVSAVVALSVRDTKRTDTSMSASYVRAAREGREIKLVSSKDHAMMAGVALMSDGTGYVKNAGLHALPKGKVYQLWVIAPGRKEPISAGVLGNDPQYAGFKFVGTVGAVALSIEDSPGAVAPTSPIAVGEVA